MVLLVGSSFSFLFTVNLLACSLIFGILRLLFRGPLVGLPELLKVSNSLYEKQELQVLEASIRDPNPSWHSLYSFVSTLSTQ